MPITKLTPENNYPYLEDRLKALEQAVPEAFADGKINWDTLREALGENLEDEGRDEYFGLNWPGKREARRRAATPSRATLVPAPGDGVNEDTTKNLFIEGDNLEVLKLLQKSYAGKIKMIYIDPPYNTGNDFIYNDNFTDPLEAYLQYTGAKGESGELLTTNTRADGRFHSRWLNMMYPRLILARQLLREDGVMFISIDDNEVNHLKLLCDEVFGDGNTEIMIWHKVGDDSGRLKITYRFRREHEYILVVYKDKNSAFFSKYLSDRNYKNEYTNPDNDPRGAYKQGIISHTEAKSKSTGKNYYTVTTPSGRKFSRQWRVTEKEFNELRGNNRIYFGKTGDSVPSLKVFINEQGETTPISILENLGTAKTAGLALRELFDGKDVFDYPKPVELIFHLIRISTLGKDLILDFFAGSATTAEAVFKANSNDGGERNFILVQLPEHKTENIEGIKTGFDSISQVGKERIRRAINMYETDAKGKSGNLPLLEEHQPLYDLGFKVFIYASSAYKKWNPTKEDTAGSLATLFDEHSDPLVENWKKEDLLSEVLLLEGFPLTSKVTYLEELLKNQVYRMSAPDFCAHDLFVCLDETVQPVTIDLLTMGKEDIFICLDSALSDELKARVQDKFNVHVI